MGRQRAEPGAPLRIHGAEVSMPNAQTPPRSPYRISEERRAELMAIAQAMSGVRVPEEPPLKPERHARLR